ncbi:MAG: DUF1150 domain-containing protein [Alphaproteobacteria bacterium]|nr:DUF1150 domain-containing protein [Alphaproteobacteria bacterium]
MDMLETVTLKALTQQDLVALGIGEIAYLRAVSVQGEEVVAVMGADGRQVGLAPDRDSAVFAALQHDLLVVPVH